MVTVKDHKGGHGLLRLHRNRTGRNDTGDHFDGRRFSRFVRSQKTENLSGFRLKREVINRLSRRPAIRF